MFRLHDKHPRFNRSVLWPVFLFAVALVVPWVLAESFPNPSESKTSSSQPSPQSQSLPQPPSNQLVAKQQGNQHLASNTLSKEQTPDHATSTTASNSLDSKTNTNTPPSNSTEPKTNTPSIDPKTNTPQSKSTDQKASTSQVSKPAANTQASESSKPNKQQQSKSQTSQKSKANASQPSYAMPTLEIRVAIANEKSSLVVGTSTAAEVQNARGKVLGRLSANQASNVVPNGSNIRIGKWETPAGVWVKPAKGGYVFVGDSWYRGDVLLVSQGNTLLAVNYVELESYIASVVGSEVPASWPMDALKAQAIAARSYAIVHYLRPANALYDLGNTQRWQVYKGLKSEWNTTRQAAEETKGVFLSYKGGVVESMYAADDKIIKNVHGGRGMSQNGALSMAQQGYNYQQILSKYYPGAGLAWMDTKQSGTE